MVYPQKDYFYPIFSFVCLSAIVIEKPYGRRLSLILFFFPKQQLNSDLKEEPSKTYLCQHKYCILCYRGPNPS